MVEYSEVPNFISVKLHMRKPFDVAHLLYVMKTEAEIVAFDSRMFNETGVQHFRIGSSPI